MTTWFNLTLLCPPIDRYEAESWAIASTPLEVIEARPVSVTLNDDTVPQTGGDAEQCLLDVGNPLCVICCSNAVFRHENGLACYIACMADGRLKRLRIVFPSHLGKLRFLFWFQNACRIETSASICLNANKIVIPTCLQVNVL